jgi:very-short-patch-repair endonuclease
MDFARINKDKIIDLYVHQKKSSYEIAEILNTNSTKVLRALTFLGVGRRGYSEAQISSLSKGRSSHPTKGKKLNISHKEKIGYARTRAWQNMTADERREMSRINKEKWDAMTISEKEELRRLALEAVRESSKSGSKTERHIKNGLEDNGYTVEFHKTGLVSHSTLEVDMFLPELKTAIEIDGPGHFTPIWGEKKMMKQQNADSVKQGILMDAGYVVLRIRQLDKSISLTRMNMLLTIILNELSSIQKNFPEKSKRLIEIEVKNGESRRI